MSYPGNPELSAEAQERVITAFRQVVRKLQEGRREEAGIGLEFVLRLDDDFAPAKNLQAQLAAGGDLDLDQVLMALSAPTTEEIDMLLVDAVEEFNSRRFAEAQEKVKKVLADIPGHRDARELSTQIEKALKVKSQVGQFLAQAREALDKGDPEEASNFVMMAQALDPHHPGISQTLNEIQGGGSTPPPQGMTPDEPPPPEPAPDVADDGPFDDGATMALDPSEVAAHIEAAQEEPEAQQEAVAFDDPFDDTGAEDAGGEAPSFDNPFAAEAVEDEAPEADPFALPDEAGAEDPFAETVDEQAPADPFAVEPEPSTEAAAEDPFAAPAAEGGGGLFGADEGSGSDLFAAAEAGADDEGRIAELLEEGQAELDAGRTQEAIDVWTRIFLIEPDHPDATARIEGARASQEEGDRRIEQLLFEAQEAFDEGDRVRCLEMLERIFILQADHPEASALRARLDEPPPDDGFGPGLDDDALPPLPDLEDDLFAEETPAAPPPPPADDAPLAPSAPAAAPAKASKARQLPVRAIATVAVALLVVLVGVWLGSRFLGGGEDGGIQVVEDTLRRADQFHGQGQTEDAVALLEGLLSDPEVSDLDKERVQARLARYRQAQTPPTPTPVPDQLVRARSAFNEGRPLEAYQLVLDGLETSPGDPGLSELRDRILRAEPLIADLTSGVRADDHRRILVVARQLVERHRGQAGYRQLLRTALFNNAVAELRAYNLTGAESLLEDLKAMAPDPGADRILEFIQSYKNAPVDMRLRIFIQSLSLRPYLGDGGEGAAAGA